jgi:glycosyltransferase involved in cell wall biosynthesis
MKICILSEFINTNSGVGSHSQSLASALKKRGYDVFILTNDRVSDNPSGVRLYTNNSTHLVGILNKITFLRGFFGFLFYSFRVLLKERPTVVHTHSFYDFYIAKLIGIILGFPVVNTHHSYIFSCPVVSRVRDGKFCVNLEENVCKEHVGFVQNIKKKITRRIHILLADAIITLNRCEYDFFKRLTGKAYFLSNWIDTSKYLIPQKKKKSKTIVFVGGYRPVKRLDIMVNAFCMLAKEDPEFKLLVIGELKPYLVALHQVNLEEYIDSIKDTIEKNNLTERVTFTGIVPASKMPELYASADIYVSCSETEVNPVAFLEAIACHLPVVAFTNPLGFNITVSTPELLSEDIKRTLNEGLDGQLFNQIRAHYSEQAIIRRFEILYHSLVKGQLKRRY